MYILTPKTTTCKVIDRHCCAKLRKEAICEVYIKKECGRKYDFKLELENKSLLNYIKVKIMLEVRLGEKGQFTLPKSFRDQYDLKKGDNIRLIDLGNGVMEVISLKHSSKLKPPVIKPKKSASIEEINAAIAAAIVEKFKTKDSHDRH